jgi:hypothetical protein
MKLIIDSVLSEPPSEISCFRDVTLYGKTFIFEDVLLSCKKGTRTLYWEWLKKHGAHDFISYLLTDEEKESGFRISNKRGNVNIDRICVTNLDFIIQCLTSVKR